MKEVEVRRLFAANLLCVFAVVVTAVVPAFLWDGFTVLGTHLAWLCICSVCVGAVNVILHLVLKPNRSPKRSSLAHKISRFLKCCIYFFMSCIVFHAIIVLYGAPLLGSVTETFLFSVLLSTFTTLQCLCMLGPNIQAWIRVFSKNGAMSIWESSLQITTVCSILGAWFGAFPIPLDWDRPWQGLNQWGVGRNPIFQFGSELLDHYFNHHMSNSRAAIEEFQSCRLPLNSL